MHELGIVFHIIDTVEQVGRENGVTQVAALRWMWARCPELRTPI